MQLASPIVVGDLQFELQISRADVAGFYVASRHVADPRFVSIKYLGRDYDHAGRQLDRIVDRARFKQKEQQP